MPKFNVSLDLLLAVSIEIEADDAHEAMDQVWNMPRSELLRMASTEETAIGINEDSVIVDLIVEVAS